MRILVFGINYFPELTGIGKYTGEMVEKLGVYGHDVRVVTAPPYYPEWCVADGYSAWCYSYNNKANVSVWRCPVYVPEKPTAIKRIIHLASFALSSIPVMARQIFWCPDVVLVVEPPLFCTPIALVISKLSKAKSWLHVQDFEVDAAFGLGLLSSSWLRHVVLNVEHWFMRRFDRVSTISSRMMDKLGEKGVLTCRQVLFPNWVDTTQIYPLERRSRFKDEMGISRSTFVALYSGNMGAKQGLEIVIEAARNLKDRKDIVFIMCGQGAACAQLRGLAVGLDNIRWIALQPVERLNELLNLADVHLLPQKAGAADLVMPSKLTGMLASGRPILATAEVDTQIADVLKTSGVVVPPDDINMFTNALTDLSEDPERRRQMGEEARKYAVDNLGYDTVLRDFEQVLQEYVSTK